MAPGVVDDFQRCEPMEVRFALLGKRRIWRVVSDKPSAKSPLRKILLERKVALHVDSSDAAGRQCHQRLAHALAITAAESSRPDSRAADNRLALAQQPLPWRQMGLWPSRPAREFRRCPPYYFFFHKSLILLRKFSISAPDIANEAVNKLAY